MFSLQNISCLTGIGTFIIALIYLIIFFKDRPPKLDVTISIEISELFIGRKDKGGFHLPSKVPCVVATLINRGRFDIYISDIEVILNKTKIRVYPHGLYSGRSPDRIPLMIIEPILQGRRKRVYFYGQEILDAYPGKEDRLPLTIRVISETNKNFAQKISLSRAQLVDNTKNSDL